VPKASQEDLAELLADAEWAERIVSRDKRHAREVKKHQKWQKSKDSVDEQKRLAQAAPARPRPAGPAPAPHPEPEPADPTYVALPFDSPYQVLCFVNPAIDPHVWQIQECMRLAGYIEISPSNPAHIGVKVQPTDREPFYYGLVAANGSGKDAYIIAPFALWFCLSKVGSRCIITSSSHEQLKNQTFAYIKRYAAIVNQKLGEKIFEIVEFHVRCIKTGSEIKCFVTDEAGKAEGYHPFPEFPNAEMAVVVNEAKSIDDKLFEAFSRFTGYNYWLEISSPGGQNGKFYRSYQTARLDKQVLGEFFFRRITAFECPHIPARHIEMMKRIDGENSFIYRSSVLAEFTADDENAYIPLTITNYDEPLHKSYNDFQRRAGLDLALGGDETVLSIWFGNKREAQAIFNYSDPNKLHRAILDYCTTHKLKAEQIPIYTDNNGIGRPIGARLKEAGLNIIPVNANGRPANARDFGNKSAEMWYKIRRLIEAGILILPKDDSRFMTQLTSRRAAVRGGKLFMEDKQTAKADGRASPDRVDAAVLAFAEKPLSDFINNDPSIPQKSDNHAAMKSLLNAEDLSPEQFDELQERYQAHREQLAEKGRKGEQTHYFTTRRGSLDKYIHKNQHRNSNLRPVWNKN